MLTRALVQPLTAALFGKLTRSSQRRGQVGTPWDAGVSWDNGINWN